MVEQRTRERILAVALELFSRKGYQGVSVEDIAQGVGIRAPSLYKHFPGKEAIFQALLTLGTEALPPSRLAQAEGEAKTEGGVSEELLWGLALGVMDAALQEGDGARVRRLLALERYRDPGLGERYLRQWVDAPTQALRGFFDRLIEAGYLRRGEPGAMAAQFLAPVLVAIDCCDADPGRRPQAEEDLRQHIHLFHRVFTPKSPAQPAPRPWRR